MREIKYRVFDHKLKMMFEVTELKQIGGGIPFIKGEKGDKGGESYVTGGYANKKTIVNGKQDFRFKLMQYTGFKDDNGNEIYEGDIVKGMSTGNLYEVVFSIGSFRISNIKYPNSNVGLVGHEHIHLIIIGNRYDNPELLD